MAISDWQQEFYKVSCDPKSTIIRKGWTPRFGWMLRCRGIRFPRKIRRISQPQKKKRRVQNITAPTDSVSDTTISDDYKVARLGKTTSFEGHKVVDQEIQVYSLNSNSVKRLPPHEFTQHFIWINDRPPEELVNNALHWVMLDKHHDDDTNLITALDLHTFTPISIALFRYLETFQETEMDIGCFGWVFDLVELGRKISGRH
ncbi:OLC1v1006059C1 [Oldenlandia corymbosa var. corymbosa]|uniref:OLC1v1006059C1 n=1 Tax=Oldenlandia corymbosa var. corymbosa TaxID=529605 RepID=A0AAV1DIH1_OLDCO|nr:OLC1v1006059C1 [Oldenlandia corymbosa var. corymbosa]